MNPLDGIIIAIAVIFFTIIVILLLVMTFIFCYGIMIPEGEGDYHLGHPNDNASDTLLNECDKMIIFPPKCKELSKFELETDGIITASDSSFVDESSRLAFVKRLSAESLFIPEPINQPGRRYLKSQLTNFRKTLVLQAMIENSINPAGGTVTCVKDVNSSEKITIGSIVVVQTQFDPLNGSHGLIPGDLLQVLRFYIRSFDDNIEHDKAVPTQDSFVWCTGILLRSYILQTEQTMCFKSRQMSASGQTLLRDIPLDLVSVEADILAMMTRTGSCV